MHCLSTTVSHGVNVVNYRDTCGERYICLSDSVGKVSPTSFPPGATHARLRSVSGESVSWLNYVEVATRLGVLPGKVRRLVQDRTLLSKRLDGVLHVPEVFLDDVVMGELRGTATLLIDGGFSEEEALDWFLRDDDTLGTTPVDAIAQGRKREVRRLAQSLAL